MRLTITIAVPAHRNAAVSFEVLRQTTVASHQGELSLNYAATSADDKGDLPQEIGNLSTISSDATDCGFGITLGRISIWELRRYGLNLLA